MLEDGERGFWRAVGAVGQHDIGLGDIEPLRVRHGHDGGFGHQRMLDQHAFQLEGRDAVVGRFEHIIGAADIGEVAVRIAVGDVAGAVDVAGHRFDAAVIALVAAHQAGWAGIAQRQAERAFLGVLIFGVQQAKMIAGHGHAHRAGLDRQARRVGDLQGGFGLAVAVADGDAPGALDLLDHLRVQRFAGAEQFTQRNFVGFQVFLHEHAPGGRGRAERGDFAVHQGFQQRLRVKARLVGDEDGGAGHPGGEEAGPGVFGPAGAGDGVVDVAGHQAEPVHRRQMADGVGFVAVQHQLRAGGGAGGEIHKHRVVGVGVAIRHEGR